VDNFIVSIASLAIGVDCSLFMHDVDGPTECLSLMTAHHPQLINRLSEPYRHIVFVNNSQSRAILPSTLPLSERHRCFGACTLLLLVSALSVPFTDVPLAPVPLFHVYLSHSLDEFSIGSLETPFALIYLCSHLA
jgi:hypothetical protein